MTFALRVTFGAGKDELDDDALTSLTEATKPKGMGFRGGRPRKDVPHRAQEILGTDQLVTRVRKGSRARAAELLGLKKEHTDSGQSNREEVKKIPGIRKRSGS